MVASQHLRARTSRKITPARVKAYKALAKRIDAQEGAAIRAAARGIFERHALIRDIVRRLKEVRLRKGVSLSELAVRTGIAKPNLSRLENNERASPTLETLHRYAMALGMTVRVELN